MWIEIESCKEYTLGGGKVRTTICAERTALGTLYTVKRDYEPAGGEVVAIQYGRIATKEFDAFGDMASSVPAFAKVRTGEITEADIEAMLDAAEPATVTREVSDEMDEWRVCSGEPFETVTCRRAGGSREPVFVGGRWLDRAIYEDVENEGSYYITRHGRFVEIVDRGAGWEIA